MQKQYGDKVIYVRNGVEINALVLVSTVQQVSKPGVPNDFQRENGLHVPATLVQEEHLSLSYLDPLFAKGALSSTDMDRAVARAIGIGPLQEGGTNGWKVTDRIEGSPREVVEAVQFGAASEEIAKLRKGLSDANNTIEKQDDEILALKTSAEPKAAEATAAQELPLHQACGTRHAEGDCPGADEAGASQPDTQLP